ncbi:glycosyltransferase family 4 protein [Flavihumibacter sp. UBA7668]|uniref:glycosyltransferase family 4 protein n=1 Tax=Flavihumibacter sp. UBA7668 TaxID=1946542 RepID=UPI0025BC40B8|nr:glycosyltransferase family 1 protein [Flavihumibacter sp. UBA7668]
MKIAVDLKNSWLYGKGISGFTMNLLQDLAKISPLGHTVDLFSPAFDTSELKNIQKIPAFTARPTRLINRESRIHKIWYDQAILLQYLNTSKPDLFFSPYFDLPYLYIGKTISTIHDLAVLDLSNQYGKLFSAYYSILLNKCVRESAYILTVSDYSRNRLIDKFNIPGNRIHVFYNKVHPAFKESSIEISLPALPGEFLLYTGGLDKRKNISLLIQGYQAAKREFSSIPPLVITGISKENIEKHWSGILQLENVIPLEYLSFPEIVALYRKATLLVNTSGYEGFGMPVLESLTVGKPIICSDIDVFREIGQDLVYYFKSHSVESFTAAIVAYFKGQLTSVDPGAMMRRADEFNEQTYGQRFLDLIQSA